MGKILENSGESQESCQSENVRTMICKGPFTVSVSVSVCSDAKKWVQLTSMVLFTLNDAKHQRKKTQTLTLTLTVNRPLGSWNLHCLWVTFVSVTRYSDRTDVLNEADSTATES